MKKLIIIFLLATASHFSFAEVTGNAFLQGQTIHSGIKVKFTPNSPTAVLDSTYTNASGSYSILLQPGVYFVTFSKPGYETVQYNNGSPVVISSNYILSDVTLQPGGSIIYLSGDISGTLTSENIYIVTDDITIPQNQLLFIQPGTIIKLQTDCNIDVYGVLKAIGTEEEKIVFTSAESVPNIEDWGYFTFHYFSYDTCTLKHCKIEYGNVIYLEPPVIIESCELCYLSLPVYCYMGDYSQFISNYIHDFSLRGIHINSANNVNIRNNIIVLNGLNYSGITAESSTGIIANNIIYCTMNQTSDNIEGISVSYGNWQIFNNIVDHCNYGFYGGAYEYIIANNIFSNNNIAGIIAGGSNYSDCIIQSNIIIGNAVGFENFGANDLIDFSYNDVWDNLVNYDSYIPGIGQIISTNNNGDPCDPYFNITLDPLFVDIANLDFHVNEGSPVIDAGINDNVVSLLDLDGYPRIMDGNNDGVAIVDMGVYEFIDSLILISDFTCPDSACTGANVTIEYLGTPNAAATFHWNFDGGIIASGSGAGPYQVYWQDTGSKTISLFLSFVNNYSDTTYHNIIIGQTVATSVSITSSANPICTGDEVTFIAYPVNGGESPFYQWKLNGQNVGTNSPIYTNSNLQAGNMVYCILTSSEECIVSVQSNIIFMGVFQYPVVIIDAFPNDTACITETITLNAGNPGCDYFWSTGETTQSIVVSNTSGPSGGIQTYFVEVIKGGICSGYDTTSVYFDPCTGIDDLSATSGISIFPNPSNKDFYIQQKEIINPGSITLFTSQGILLGEFKFILSESNSPFKVDLSEYPNGIYFLKFQNEEIFEVRKIIKE